MAERNRTRRNTLERRCLPKTFKRMFVGAPKGIFKMLEKIKKAEASPDRRSGGSEVTPVSRRRICYNPASNASRSVATRLPAGPGSRRAPAHCNRAR
jgi:hypothetical protein